MIEIELIVGTMGLDKILADKLPKYNESLLNKAASTLKTFKRGAKEFSEMNEPGNLPDESISLSDFDDLSAAIQQDQEVMEAVAGLETWPTELQMEVSVLVADVKAYLAGQLPTNQVTGSIMGHSLPCSDSDKFRFLFQANLANDIRTFVELLNSGAITPIESALMRTLFPQTHDYLIIEIMDRVLDATVDGTIDEWEGGWRKSALSGLLGVPVASFTDVLQYQTGMQEKTAGRPKGPGAVQVAGFNLTDNQKLETDTIDQSKI